MRRILPLLFVAVAAGCGGSETSTSGRSDERPKLPVLPARALVVQTRPREVVLAGLDGRRLGRLRGLDLVVYGDGAARLRSRAGKLFLLEPGRPRLRPVAGSYRMPESRAPVPDDCEPGPRLGQRLYLLCGHTVEILGPERRRSILVRSPPRGRVGHWAGAHLSPDRRTLLLQWSAECEVPVAFFAPARGGSARAVSGERDWTRAPTSVALGWGRGGRAIVHFPQGACGGGRGRPGVYSVDPRTSRARLVLSLPGMRSTAALWATRSAG